jgi:hypothetical protein
LRILCAALRCAYYLIYFPEISTKVFLGFM